MSVHKRKYRDGRVVWRYLFNAPGSTRQNRIIIQKVGFATKKEAQESEATRRIEEQKRYEMEKAGAGVTAAVPTSLGTLLQEFLEQHVKEHLAPKTIERYREMAAYIDPELLKRPLAEITPLHLNREWSRLLKSGGHTRKTKKSRPMSAKTVRNIAGVVSSAFARAIKWGVVTTNPATNSEPPRVKKRLAMALTPAQQDMLIAAATHPWCLRTFLETAAATGCRRGELLALRWSDVVDGCVIVARSLTQTYRTVDTPTGKIKVHDVLDFKSTKTEKPRVVALPVSAIAALETHRKQQDELRRKFSQDYRADLDLVFANTDGTMLKPDSISASVSLIFKRMKIPKPKGDALHLLRHSHTSVLLASGVPLPAVSARLGHSAPQTTLRIYSHMITGQDQEAARKWEEYQKQNRPGAEERPEKRHLQ
jgi:integrase